MSQYNQKKRFRNPIKRFLIMCSGADQQLLSECPPSEDAKYVGIGGAVFFTACMAMLSATFAINTFIEDTYIQLAVGFFWGLLIFNLDRYIVASIRKNVKGQSGKKRSEFMQALPRIILAILFAVIISKPLELEIFRNEIALKLPEAGRNQAQFIQQQIDSLKSENDTLKVNIERLERNPIDSFTAIAVNDLTAKEQEFAAFQGLKQKEINRIEANIRSQNNKINAYRRRIDELNTKVANGTITTTEQSELDGKPSRIKSATNRIYRYRQDKKSVLKEIDAKRDELNIAKSDTEKAKSGRKNTVRSRIQEMDNRIKANNQKIAQKEKELEQKAASYDGILAKLEAMELLKAEKREIQIADWLIFLLFISVEVAPIFVKLISPVGVYDKKLALQESGIGLNGHNGNTNGKVYTSNGQIKVSNVPKGYVDAIDQIKMDFQREIVEMVIEKQRDKLKRKLESSDSDEVMKNIINSINAAGSTESFLSSQKIFHENGIAGDASRTNGFEGKLGAVVNQYWVTNPNGSEVAYYFKDNYEFEYRNNAQVHRGSWNDDSNNPNILEVVLNNQTRRLEIKEVNETVLKLYDSKSNRISVLQKM